MKEQGGKRKVEIEKKQLFLMETKRTGRWGVDRRKKKGKIQQGKGFTPDR